MLFEIWQLLIEINIAIPEAIAEPRGSVRESKVLIAVQCSVIVIKE